MVRNISVDGLAAIAQQYGVKPLNILEVAWNSGTVIRYADRDITGIQGKILDISSFDDVIDISQKGSTASISVTLDDTDGSLRTLMNSYDIHKRPCVLYQYFEGLPLTDMFPIFKGYIVSPITWSEGERTLSFDILSKIHSREVGFSPEQGQFANIPPDLIGKVWPLCFGSPIHVPCTRSNETLTGATVSLFGLPDPTLDAKRKQIEIGIESLTNTYNFFNYLLKTASGMLASASELQDEYVDYIIDEDKSRQEREDIIEEVEAINQQVKFLVSEFDDATEEEKGNVDTPGDLRYRLKQVRDLRDSKISDVKALSAKLNNLEYDKKTVERDFKYSKYLFNVVGKLRKKMGSLLEEYYDLQDKLRALDIIRQDQVTLMTPSVTVTNGYRFPQNQNTIIEIGNQYFNGVFDGNKFTFQAALPTYTNVLCGPKRDTDLNTFYIQDQTVKLQGKYALLPNGMIIKITGQEGLRCTFELRSKPVDDLRLKKRDISGLATNISNAKQLLSNVLTGEETDEEILAIMNNIPQDLSKHVWDRLVGGGDADTQVITMRGAPSGGTFNLYIDEYKSVNIPYNASKNDIKAVMLAFPNIVALIESRNGDVGDIIVTGGPLPDNDIEIKFAAKLWPMPQIRADGNDLTGEPRYQTLRTFGGTDDQVDTFTVNVNGEISLPIPYNVSAAGLKTILVKMSGYKSTDIETTGGPAHKERITITYRNDVVPTISTTVTKDPEAHAIFNIVMSKVQEAKEIGPGPTAACYVKSTGGAHEHTVGEIEKLINDAIGKSQYKKTLEDVKKKLIGLFNSKDGTVFAIDRLVADDFETFQEIVKFARIYIQLLRSIQIPQSVTAEAYALISQHEYDVLMNFEILNYMNWVRSIDPVLEEVPDEADKYYITGRDITLLKEVSGNLLPQWIPTLLNGDYEEIVNNIQKLPTTQAFIAQVGTRVTLAGNFQEKYIANILPSTVHGVYAYRSIDGIRQLFPVPTRYYVKNEADNYGPIVATSITLRRPLSDYNNEHWEEGIYVTLTSSVGPNTADIIKWIAQNYTTLSIDNTSFDAVADAIENYPSHFALFSLQDAIGLMQDIAWQARCAVFMKMDTLYIKYLAAEADSIDEINEDDIDFQSLALTCTPTEDLVTKLTATWKPSYNVDDYKLILRTNMTKYDVVAEEFNFFIYNIYELVLKSATFWMIRRGNTWKRATFSVPLNKLNLETYDTITLSLQNNLIATGDTKAIVESANYDSKSNSIQMECWLPIRFGEMTPFTFAWPASGSVQNIFPSIDIVLGGNAGNPIGDKVPTGLPFDPTSQSNLGIRPNDYGDLVPSDTGDALPRNPANDIEELDYNDVEVSNFDLNPPKNLADKTQNQTNQPDELHAGIGSNQDADEKLKQYTNVRIGIVESFKGFTDSPNVPGEDPDATKTRQIYNVRLQSGTVVEVVQMQIHPEDRIPFGTTAYVIQTGTEYQMQVPVWLGEADVTS